MDICAVVVAAGRGVRLRSKIPKPLVRLGSKQLLSYSLLALSRCPKVRSIVVVASRSNLQAIERCVRAVRTAQRCVVVEGGKRRQDSVRNGLRAVPEACDYVLIHDAARPFVDAGCLARLIAAVGKTHAAILGVPVKSTIKEVSSGRASRHGVVRQTLSRSLLWEIQTPQAFRKDIIATAYEHYGMIDVTDDSALVEKLGVPVSVVMGSYRNMKITTPEDMCVARALLTKGRTT